MNSEDFVLAWRRPQSLKEVVEVSTDPDAFALSWRNFLDAFYADPSFDKIKDEPPLMANMPHLMPDGEKRDVQLAAIAESLAILLGVPPPPWSESRSMPHECFPALANYGDKLKDFLRTDSPEPFRKRNLFCTGNALSRA